MLLSARTTHKWVLISLAKQATWAKSLLSIYILWPKPIKPCPYLPLTSPTRNRTWVWYVHFTKKYTAKITPLEPAWRSCPWLLKAPRPVRNSFIDKKHSEKSFNGYCWLVYGYQSPLSIPQSKPRIMKNWKISSWITLKSQLWTSHSIVLWIKNHTKIPKMHTAWACPKNILLPTVFFTRLDSRKCTILLNLTF